MVNAAIHVTTGADTMSFESGVDFFDPQHLAEHTKGLLCPVQLSDVAYASTTITNCGVTQTFTSTPERVVTLHQGSTELLLAMGLQDKMVGHASMDDEIWHRYKDVFDQIPLLSPSGLPTEDEIMAVQPDFIVGAYGSAFAEVRCDAGEDCATADSRAGIFSDATVGPCDGENSDFFPAGDPSYTAPYSTCHEVSSGATATASSALLPAANAIVRAGESGPTQRRSPPRPSHTRPLAACRA